MKISITIFLIFILLFSYSQGNSSTFDHQILNNLLQQNVNNGLVNYLAWSTNRSGLSGYLLLLEKVESNEFKSWSKNEQMAFWINAYNAITLKAILQNYPVQWGSLISRARFPKNSIRQINKAWDTVYSKVMGKELTLNQIEHEILRKQFHDPRIHFVINCASIGCPKLENRAFFAHDLEQRLEQATQNFISDSTRVNLNKKDNTLYLSSIFKWYKTDFEPSQQIQPKLKHFYKSEAGIVEFISLRLPLTDQQFIINHHPKIKYRKYDWTLNEQR